MDTPTSKLGTSPKKRTTALALALALLPLACGTESEAPAAAPAPQAFDPGPYRAPATSSVIEDGKVKIRREVFLVPGATAEPNPATGTATPPELQRVRVVRYRVDADPPLPARAIAVMMPGFLGGAGSFEPAARALVRRSAEGDAIEAWAIDRRSNLLEDHHGLDVAEHFRDAERAARYYLEGEEVEGKTFGQFVPQSAAGYMSEWGIATTVGDLRAAIELVPQAERRGRVVLVGHSLGASISEIYASWDFQGTPGFAELAGLVMIDGATGSEGAAQPQRTQEQYEKGGDTAPGGFGTAPGVEGIRKSQRYFELPLLGMKVYPVASIVSLRGVFAPTAVVDDPDRDNLLRSLLALKSVPRMTNRAALGLSFDARSNALAFAAINAGEVTGGAVEEYDNAIFQARLVHPTDLEATYGWREFDATSPPEHTSLDEFARIWFDGPGLDFAEWYFPQRLAGDVPVASSLTLSPDDWPAKLYGMRAFHGKAIDLPVLGHAAGLMKGDVGNFDKLRALLSGTAIGPDRPRAGEARSSDKAFATYASPELSHIDPLVCADVPGSRCAIWYDALAAWARDQTFPGGVSVAARQ